MKNIYVLGLFLALSIISTAQHTNVLILHKQHLSEPSIFIDPNNTNHIMAGSNINNYFYSTDGGYTWSEKILTSNFGVWGDPCIVADNQGNFYYLHLSNTGTEEGWIDRIVCQRTSDVGQTWTVDAHMGLNGTADQDKEWAIIDYNNNNMYVTWTQFDKYNSSNPNDYSNIMFSKSTDMGETWSPAKRINQTSGDCIDSDNTTEGAVPAVGANGEIYVSWAGPEGLMFDKSLDEGETWLDEDIFVSDIPGGWDFNVPGISRCNGLPVTCCNLAEGPYNGDIYINWSDQRNGEDDTDIWFVKSTDGGNTWSEAKRVNDDDAGKQQFFTWMTVDRVTGYIWIVFYDRRNYDNNNTDVYMAVSKDGGESFKNFKVSESPFLPYATTFFGDYTNVSAHNNVVRPIWARLEGYSENIMTAIINTEILNIEGEISMPFSLDQNAPNPFDESTYISFKLRKTEKVSLKIFDTYGRLVCTLVGNQKMDRGKYTYHFSADEYSISPGVYYFSLSTDKHALQRKMLVL